MITVADLILKFLNSIFDSKLKLTNLKRDRRDRIADYFEQISKTLMDAAVEFENSGRPWGKYREISFYIKDFLEVVGSTIKIDKKVIVAYRELIAAARADRLLLSGTPEQTIVDAITVRPEYSYSEYKYQEINPIKNLSEPELKRIITNEINRIKEASGLFQAMAAQLRATD